MKLLKEAKNKSLNSKIMGVKLGKGESNRETRKSRKWGEGNYFLREPSLLKKRRVLFLFTINQLLKIFVFCFWGAWAPSFMHSSTPANGTKSKIYSDHLITTNASDF